MEAEDFENLELKKHRKLTENQEKQIEAIDKLSDWIIEHHIDNERLEIYKNNIFKKYELEKYIKQKIPTSIKTQKGNGTEILCIEYLKASSGLELLIYKLRYNPNIEQSMKGDDVLLFDKKNLRNKIILGEAKFRETSSKETVDSITKEFSTLKNPISLQFIIDILLDKKEEEKNIGIELLKIRQRLEEIPIVNAGFILSDEKTYERVEKNMCSNNPNFIIISFSTVSPSKIIEDSFKLANEKLANKFGENNE